MSVTPGVNKFLTFAEIGSVPEMLMSDEDYKNCIRRKTGFAAGEPADNSLMNTVLRNVSLAVKGLTDYVASNGVDVSQTVKPEEIKKGFELGISTIIKEQVNNIIAPMIEEMQKKLDAYAAACHGVPVGGIIPISCSEEELDDFLEKYPSFAVCNGLNGTIDLSDRFIVCASPNRKQGTTGGSKTIENLKIKGTKLKDEHLPKHKHEVPGSLDAFTVEKWPFGAPIGATTYIGSPSGSEGFRAYSSSVGKNKEHDHELEDTSLKKEGILPPYYALIFVQKIYPY